MTLDQCHNENQRMRLSPAWVCVTPPPQRLAMILPAKAGCELSHSIRLGANVGSRRRGHNPNRRMVGKADRDSAGTTQRNLPMLLLLVMCLCIHDVLRTAWWYRFCSWDLARAPRLPWRPPILSEPSHRLPHLFYLVSVCPLGHPFEATSAGTSCCQNRKLAKALACKESFLPSPSCPLQPPEGSVG